MMSHFFNHNHRPSNHYTVSAGCDIPQTWLLPRRHVSARLRCLHDGVRPPRVDAGGGDGHPQVAHQPLGRGPSTGFKTGRTAEEELEM